VTLEYTHELLVLVLWCDIAALESFPVNEAEGKAMAENGGMRSRIDGSESVYS
jgi:hypothetical protein